MNDTNPLWVVPLDASAQWFQVYAELLGCEAQPASIATAIQGLKDTVQRLQQQGRVVREAGRESLNDMACRLAKYYGATATVLVGSDKITVYLHVKSVAQVTLPGWAREYPIDFEYVGRIGTVPGVYDHG